MPNYQVNLADILVDFDAPISHNLAALQSLFGKNPEKGEARVAEILVKISNASSLQDIKGGIMSASLFFKTTKPNLLSNGTPVSTLLASPELKGWNIDNLATVIKESFGKLNVNSLL